MSSLGNKIIFSQNLKYYMDIDSVDRNRLCNDLNFKYSTVSEWLSAKKYPRIDKIEILADYFGIQKSDLIEDNNFRFKSPEITEEIATFPVIGEIAAGYDHIAEEDWSGETVDIPVSYLHGRSREDFFVLSVKGDSMYPMYIEGDKVLILRQSTLNRSGEVGVVIYNGDMASLKKVEYVMGEDWMKMIPLNPNYPPVTISGADLELCRILGIPKLIIREVE